MADAYLAVLIFAAVALLVPALMLAFSKLVRRESDGNDVETQNYESAVEGVGKGVTMMTEYAHYFVIFLAFEILGAVVITVEHLRQAARLGGQPARRAAPGARVRDGDVRASAEQAGGLNGA